MSYLRSQLPHNPDFPTVAEELRKLIKRTDEIERESRIAQQKITQYEKDITKLNGRCDAYARRIEELEGRNLQLENRCKAVYVHSFLFFVPLCARLGGQLSQRMHLTSLLNERWNFCDGKCN